MIVREAIAGKDAAAKLTQIVAAVILAPALEEIIYRGVLLAWAAETFSPGLAVSLLLSSGLTWTPCMFVCNQSILNNTGVFTEGRLKSRAACLKRA